MPLVAIESGAKVLDKHAETILKVFRQLGVLYAEEVASGEWDDVGMSICQQMEDEERKAIVLAAAETLVFNRAREKEERDRQ